MNTAGRLLPRTLFDPSSTHLMRDVGLPWQEWVQITGQQLQTGLVMQPLLQLLQNYALPHLPHQQLSKHGPDLCLKLGFFCCIADP